ncbi:MAG: rhodanese-like domain-containing protein [Gemmatimonadota bacterium]
MILQRFHDENLAQTSYLIGCAATGEALVVDASRDAGQYIRAAASENVRITHITETHIHADYVSGSRELAAKTGAQLYLSGEGGPEWEYAFADVDGAVLLKDGDSFGVGSILIEAVHTPGHTPEHLSFLVTDGATADRPIGILTGDFVFVGDVGRPDLLEKVAGQAHTMEASARTLFRSLQRFRAYPDYLQILPGHGAGSACGKGISAVPSSTVGYELRFNWAFSITGEDEFVDAVLAGQPEPPAYFAQLKKVNRAGPRVLGGLPQPQRLPGAGLAAVLEADACVIDARGTEQYGSGHIPGTLGIPLDRSFSTWAGWLIPYDCDVYLIADESDAVEAAKDLAMIGLDRVAGWFDTDVLEAWRNGGRELETVRRITSRELAARMRADDVKLLDVRGRVEWETAHIPGAENIPVGLLEEHLDRIPRDSPVVVHCQSGARSAIAASVLRVHGFGNVANLDGGLGEWQAAGLPIERATGAV